MLRIARNYSRLMFPVTFFSCFVIVLLLSAANSHSAQADISDMHNLFARLDERIGKQEVFLVFVELHTPISGKETSLVLNDRQDKKHNLTEIKEIGSDYVCFTTLAGDAEEIGCTAFSNVAGISYLNN
jgi:hypothetical protein